MTNAPQRRLSLLYQLYLVNQEARRFMRLALLDTEMTGEEYALYSYLHANGPRTLTQAAQDLGEPVTTLASKLASAVKRGDVARRSHPKDRRARLLQLTDAGTKRLLGVIPAFTTAHHALQDRLREAGADDEELFRSLEQLRSGISRTSDLLEAESEGTASR